MRTLKLGVAYDGTPFVGWQRQAEGVSVQSQLEDALGRIEGRPVTVVGAGRTDAGVHALAQAASCTLEHPIPIGDLRRALNAMLPPEVRVTSVEEAPGGFHARYSARGKTYRYAIVNGEVVSPFLVRYAWHVDVPLSVPAMADAARHLEGTHDFAVFQSSGNSAKTTTRTIRSSLVSEVRPADLQSGCSPPPPDAESGFSRTDRSVESGFSRIDRVVESGFSRILSAGSPSSRLILYEVSGDGFLRHMVRAIVGSLVEVGAGRQRPAWFAHLLDSGRREAAGPTAPAHGLWLLNVEY